jgi:hypothetical protein
MVHHLPGRLSKSPNKNTALQHVGKARENVTGSSLFMHMVYCASQVLQDKLLVEMATHVTHMTSGDLTCHHLNGNWCKAALTIVQMIKSLNTNRTVNRPAPLATYNFVKCNIHVHKLMVCF